MKRLYRSTKNKMLLGVCGGLARYFGIDPTLVRLLWVTLSLILGFGLLGVLIYIICGIIMPKEPDFIEASEIEEVDE